MTTTERPERSVPKPVFTDAEAGAREFPDSGASARRYNYFTPAKRKQTHYEDVTVDVQPDPRHYLSQGWIYGFANGETGYPLHWTKLKAWGVDRARAAARDRQRRDAGPELARPRVARVPRPERGVGADPLPLQRERRPPAQPERRERPQLEGVRLLGHQLGALRRAARRRVDAHRAHPRALRVRLQRALRARRTCTTPRWRPTARARSGSRRTWRCTTSPSPRRSRASTARRTSRRGTPTPSGRAPASSPRR